MTENKATTRVVKSPKNTVDLDSPAMTKEHTFEYKGETFTVREDVLDDIDILEALEDERYLTALRTMLGTDAWKRAKDCIRDESGRAHASEMEGLIEVIMGAVNPSPAS